MATGRQRVTNVIDAAEITQLRNSVPDVKERFELGREPDPEFDNLWPTESEVLEFRQTMVTLLEEVHVLHLEVLRAIVLRLNLDPTFFDAKCNVKWHTLRLLHYPPTPLSTSELQGADTGDLSHAGAHPDNETMTLLLQGELGLQVRDPSDRHWVDATPIDETTMINVSDLLSRWSNDVLVSTVHRVTSIPPSREGTLIVTSSSRSSPTPNPDTRVDVLPNMVAPVQKPKYGPVIAEEYQEQSLARTYE